MSASKKRKKKRLPNFYYEKKLWSRGFKYVAGIDEVGRGSFAGPVVAGCVVFPKQLSMNRFIDSRVRIDDSKKLTEKQRVVANDWIRENAVTWGMGSASVSEINRLGMAKATHSAFRRAVANANQRLHNRIDFLLIDAFFVPFLRKFPKGNCCKITLNHNRKDVEFLLHNIKGRQLAIVNGDGRSLSIAAASIVAKVYRDDLMIKLGRRKNYQKYAWTDNKGYGSRFHRQAILKYGVTKHHRKQFVRKYDADN